MKMNGEEGPLDIFPEFINNIDEWFYRTYNNIKGLSGFEYQITISDFVNYFSIYPIPFQKYIIISIIKGIDRKASKYQEEVSKAKRKNSID